jgi:hypothetical protein
MCRYLCRYLLIVASAALTLLSGCSHSDCAYYGAPSYNTPCVVAGPGATGGGH